MKAIGYVRVSTDKQENSADAQHTRIRAQAQLKGMDLLEIIEDFEEFSGTLDRPGAKRLMSMIQNRDVDAVIITKLDRLTRSTRDAISIMELCSKKKVALVSITEALDTESPMGRFVLKLFASIAELEREMICSRTRDVMGNLKAQGLPAGTAPFGWQHQPRTAEEKIQKVKKPLIRNEAEQLVLARAHELRAEGMNSKQIASVLNGEGYRTRSGGEWVYQYVIRILKGS